MRQFISNYATNRVVWSLLILAPLALLLLINPDSVEAHVKWFVEFDVAEQPMPIGEVLDKTFVYMFIASVIGCYLFFLADRYIYEEGYLAEFDKKLKLFDGLANAIMRVAAGIFFVSLFLWWALGYGDSFYITPELKTTAPFVPWIHLIIGLCVVSRYTTPITGIGIFLLWILSVFQYGMFHMLDYVIFLGIAYFLTVSFTSSKGWLKSGFVVLFACTGLTLIWASVEKFAYADWTNPVFEKSPHMLMGMSPSTFMKLSGFMEFFNTFILLGAVSVVGRLVSLGLMSIFVLAIFEFGMVDAIGHLMIIAILFVLVVRGPTDARNMLVLPDKSLFTEAYFMTGLYYLAFVTIFLLYYGLHYLSFAPY
ncbi:MAG: hypothetical protein HKN33_02495 [Pyrinomonadaceae bacterium]|nr:hypothetical protein [Pyrinomonadaceae bacterium]